MSDTTIVYVIIAAAVVLFVTNRVPADLVAIGVALALYLTDVVTMQQAFAGFGDPTVIFIASLFVVSEALESQGVTAWAGQQLVRLAGDNKRMLLVIMMAVVAVLSALITPNGAVAALVPVVVITAVRLGAAPSEWLIPLSFASFAGALLVLTGSPVSIIASETSKEAGAGGFAYLEFAIVGVPLLIGTIVIALMFGPGLLPRRHPRSMPPDFSQHARALMRQYALDEPVFRLRVPAGSPLVGTTRDALDLSEYAHVSIVAAQEHEGGAVLRAHLGVGDVIVARGEREAVLRMAGDYGLESTEAGGLDESGLFTAESGVAEVVIPPRSEAIGAVVFPGMVTDSGDLVILSVQRAGEERPGKTTLASGDALLLRGTWQALDEQLEGDPNVRAVDGVDLLRRQLMPLGRNAWLSLAVLVGMVALLISGVVPPAVAGVIAACALVLLRVLSMQQAYRGISWTVVVLIAGMIPLSTAMTESGAAADIADGLVSAIGKDASPYLLLIALFVLVAVTGQVLSNTATALIVFPIAVAAAVELDVSIQPVLMAVTVAAHASFFTPIATTPNLMVLEPGGYRFGDYWKFGVPLMVLYFAVAIGIVPLVWRF